MKKFTLLLLSVFAYVCANAAYVPVVITSGFSHDMVANGIGNAKDSADGDVDGTFAFVSADYKATGASSAPTYALPTSGTINSVNTPGVVFQLANYNGRNGLRLNAVGDKGTLVFGTPQSAGEVYFLATAGNAGTSIAKVKVTLTFADGTTQVNSDITISDWYDKTGFAIQGIGRINRTSNALEGTATNPRLYEVKFGVIDTNRNKNIVSLTMEKTGGTAANENIITMAVTLNNAICFPVSALTATNIVSNSLTLGWTGPLQGGVAAYQWKIVAGTGPVTDAAVATGFSNTTSATPTGLTPMSQYTAYVRSTCGTSDTTAWSSGISFYTTQIPVTILPWTETFDGGGTDWTYNNGTQVNKWMTGSAVNNGGTQSLYVSNDAATNNYTLTTAATVQAWRDITIPSAYSVINLSFDWKGQGESGQDYFRVWAVPTTFVPTAGTQVAAATGRTQLGGNFQLNGAFTTASYVIPSSFAGTTFRLVFEWRNNASVGTQPPAAIDNVTIKVSNCAMPPATPTATNATANAVTLTWTAPPLGAANYEYKIVANAGLPTDPAVVTGIVSTLTATTSGLLPMSNYTAYVRSICGAGDTTLWTAGVNFWTTQVPVTVFPWTETFDGGGTDWMLNNGTQTNKWAVGSATNNGGTQSLYVSNDNGVSNAYTVNTSAVNVMHAWRDISVPSAYSVINLSFDWKGMGETDQDYFRVWAIPTTVVPAVGTTQIAAGTGRTQLGGNFQNNGSYTTANYVIPSSFAGTTFRLVFEWRNNTGTTGTQPPSSIDNVSIKLSNCAMPTALTASNFTSSGITLTWRPPAPAAGNYQYRVVASGAAPTATAIATAFTGNSDTSAVITGLSPNTNYTVYVRSICGPNDTTFWTAGLNFLTTQIPVSTFPWTETFESGGTDWTLNNGTQTNKWFVGAATGANNGGTKGAYISNDNGVTNAYTMNATSTPQMWRDIAVPVTHPVIKLSFDWKSKGEASWDYLRVWVVPTSFVPTSGTQITAGTGRLQLGGNFENTTAFATANYVIPASFSGTTFRLVFEWRNDNGGGTNPPVSVDNVKIVLSDCSVPDSAKAINITHNTATLSWKPLGAATNWQVEWDTVNFVRGTGKFGVATGAPNFNITGLDANRQYSFYVRTLCGTNPGDTTAWIGPVTFRTLLLPCQGKPTAGVLYGTSGALCTSDSLKLITNGATVASQLTYTWQSSPAGLGAWANMTGAADTISTVKNQTTATDYRLVLGCIASGQYDTSNVVKVRQRGCYCKPTFANVCTLNTGYRLDTLLVGTIRHIPVGSACATFDYTNLSTTVAAGIPIPMHVVFRSYAGISIYGDFNNDGDFDDADEWMYGNVYSGANIVTTDLNVQVPGWVPTGSYRIRVNVSWANSGKAGEACKAYDYGSFSEFTFNVLNNAGCAPPLGVNVSNVQAFSADFKWSAPALTTPLGYEWKVVPRGAGFNATGAAQGGIAVPDTAATATGLQSNTNYDVYVRSGCNFIDSSVWNGPYSFRTLLAPCSGKPEAGTIPITSTYMCSADSLRLITRGATIAAQLTYTWQSSPSGTNTWTNIATAPQDTMFTIKNQAASTDYRLVMTCGVSSQTDTTNVVKVTQRGCYCKPSFTNGCSGWRLDTVKVGSINHVLPTTCTLYDFTSMSTNVTPGVQTPMHIGGHSWSGFAVYGDFNNDGDFNDVGEWMYGGTYPNVDRASVDFNIIVPGWVPTGSYRVRVLCTWGTSPTPGQACNTFQYGNYAEYTFNVLSNTVTCAVPDTLNTANVQAYQADLSWSGPTGITPQGYAWKIVPRGSAPATTPAAASGTTTASVKTATATGLQSFTKYDFYVRTACSAADSSAWFGPATFQTLKAPCNGVPAGSQITTAAITTPLCSGNTQTLTAQDTNLIASQVNGLIYRWQRADNPAGPWTYVADGSGDSTLNYTTGGLLDTTYYRVQTVCVNSMQTATSDPIMIPVNEYSLPYYENFNSIADDKIPSCFVKNSYNGSWSVRTDYKASDGTPMIAIRLDFPSASTSLYPSKNAFFTIPALKLVAGNTYAVAFKYTRGKSDSKNNTGNAYTETLKLYADTVAPGTTVANVTDGILMFYDTVKTDKVFDTVLRITATRTGAYYFSWYSNTPNPGTSITGGTIAVDSIAVLLDCPSLPITTQPTVSTTVCSGDPITLTVGTTAANVTYQWQKDGVDIPGAIHDTYNLTSAATTDAGKYTVRVMSACRTTNSDTAEVIINPAPTPTIRNTNNTLVASGGFTSYQWYINDTLIPSATNYLYKATRSGKYKVVVKDGNGCTGSIDIVVTIDDPGTGIAGISADAYINVYPNPANDRLFVEFPATDEVVNIRITDLQGRIIAEQSIEHTTKASFNVSNYASGVYMYHIIAGARTQSGKVLITH